MTKEEWDEWSRDAKLLAEMRPVYDAAMEWEECCEEADNAPRTPDAMYRAGERVNKARERVREACRRAKEGR